MYNLYFRNCGVLYQIMPGSYGIVYKVADQLAIYHEWEKFEVGINW